jgi:hypothetical protein
MAAAEMAVGLHVANHGLDGGEINTLKVQWGTSDRRVQPSAA